MCMLSQVSNHSYLLETKQQPHQGLGDAMSSERVQLASGYAKATRAAPQAYGAKLVFLRRIPPGVLPTSRREPPSLRDWEPPSLRLGLLPRPRSREALRCLWPLPPAPVCVLQRTQTQLLLTWSHSMKPLVSWTVTQY